MSSWLVGCDVSEYQETITWSEISPGGYFSLVKISEGTSYVDRMAAQNVPGARSIADPNGWINFWYHFADGYDPVAEAQHFLAVLSQFGGLQTWEGLMYDFEKNGIADPGTYTNTFEEYVFNQTGVRPLLYSNRYLMSLIYQANPNAGKFLADPDDPPSTNAQYLGKTVPYEYVMQQYGTGSMPGVPVACDIDYFFGTLSELRAYTKQPTPVAVPQSTSTTTTTSTSTTTETSTTTQSTSSTTSSTTTTLPPPVIGPTMPSYPSIWEKVWDFILKVLYRRGL